MSASEMVGLFLRLCVGMKKISIVQTFDFVALWFLLVRECPVLVRC